MRLFALSLLCSLIFPASSLAEQLPHCARVSAEPLFARLIQESKVHQELKEAREPLQGMGQCLKDFLTMRRENCEAEAEEVGVGDPADPQEIKLPAPKGKCTLAESMREIEEETISALDFHKSLQNMSVQMFDSCWNEKVGKLEKMKINAKNKQIKERALERKSLEKLKGEIERIVARDVTQIELALSASAANQERLDALIRRCEE
jgi:hypothetical protein